MGVRRDRARARARTSRSRSCATRRTYATTRAARARGAQRARRSRTPPRRADRPRVAARLRADRRRRRRRASCSLSTGRSTAGRSTTTGGSTPRSAAAIATSPGCRAWSPAARTRRARRARGRRHRGQRRGPAARDRGVAAERRAGAQPRALARRTTSRSSREWLGVRRTIWLGEGCVGDDTHGHVDDIARFVDAGHRRARGRSRIRPTRTTRGRWTTCAGSSWRRATRRWTAPRRHAARSRAPVIMDGERLPASYANFYIANGVVLVPDVQRPERPRRAADARRADARTRGRRHPRRRSGLGPRHAALPDAAGTGGAALTRAAKFEVRS